MKVYIVTEYFANSNSTIIVDAFTTKEKAQDFIDVYPKSGTILGIQTRYLN